MEYATVEQMRWLMMQARQGGLLPVKVCLACAPKSPRCSALMPEGFLRSLSQCMWVNFANLAATHLAAGEGAPAVQL